MIFAVVLATALAAPAPTFAHQTVGGGPDITWRASDGQHAVRFRFVDVPAKGDSEERGRTMTVVHEVTAPGTSTARVVWQAKDFVTACPFDVTLNLMPGSVRTDDLDQDGTPEVSFAYVLSCKSDVSAHDMKLLMYEGSVKYALRGTHPSAVELADAGGEPFVHEPPTVDPAFNKAPPAFLALAKRRFAELQTVPAP